MFILDQRYSLYEDKNIGKNIDWDCKKSGVGEKNRVSHVSKKTGTFLGLSHLFFGKNDLEKKIIFLRSVHVTWSPQFCTNFVVTLFSVSNCQLIWKWLSISSLVLIYSQEVNSSLHWSLDQKSTYMSVVIWLPMLECYNPEWEFYGIALNYSSHSILFNSEEGLSGA